MAIWKIAPALAAGCTVVLKPAEETPLTALRLGELVLEAGFPPGVVNVVTGRGETAGAALVAHPGVDKIAFTGSTEVGKLIGRAAVDDMKRVSLELGGKSPVIVLDDCDVDRAVQGAAAAIFFNQGQVCTAGSRLYVQRGLYQKVAQGLADVAASMKLGSGFDADTQVGPLVSARHQQRVLDYIGLGRAEGGRVMAGGEAGAARAISCGPRCSPTSGPMPASCARRSSARWWWPSPSTRWTTRCAWPTTACSAWAPASGATICRACSA